MNFKDYVATDEDGNEFIFTVEMQRRLSRANLPIEPASLASLAGDVRTSRRSYGERSSQYEKNDSERRPQQERPRQERSPQDEPDFDTMFDIQIDPETGKYIGRVKWYNVKKGYGFIVRGGGEEIFFHKSGTANDVSSMNDGQWVLYDVEDTQKGPEATDVEPYDNPQEVE